MESKYCGRLSHVSIQLVTIPSSRSLLSRYKILPFDTWNISGLQENVFGYQFSTFDSPRDHHRGIHPCAPQRERESFPQATGSGTIFARDDKQSRDTIPMPTFARRPPTMSSCIPVDIPQSSMVGQQRQLRSCNSTNSPIHNRFLCGKFDSKPKSLPVLIFSRTLCCGSKKWRWLILWTSWNPRDQFMERIFQTSRCWTRRLPLL